MNILYVEDDEDIQEIYMMVLEGHFTDSEFTHCENGQIAIDKLKEGNKFDIILSDYDMPVANGGVLYQHVIENKIDTPFVLLTGRDIKDDPHLGSFLEDKSRINIYLTKPIQKEALISSFEELHNKILNKQSTTENFEQQNELWSPISAKSILKSNMIPCDIYIKINERKFIKIINANTMYGADVILKYINKGISHLYVKKQDFPKLADNISASVLKVLEVKENMNVSQLTQTANMAIEILRDNIIGCGLSPTSVKLTEQCLAVGREIIRKHNKLSELIKSLLKRDDYLLNHVHLVTYFSTAIAERLDWASESTTTRLAMAALLHDITLDSIPTARIRNTNDPEFANLSPEEQDKVKRHPLDASQIVKNYSDIPPDIDSIIFQHHESPNGDGFPRGLTAQKIMPLACVFILAEKLVDEAYPDKIKDHNAVRALIERFGNEGYSRGNFKKPYQALKSIFQ